MNIGSLIFFATIFILSCKTKKIKEPKRINRERSLQSITSSSGLKLSPGLQTLNIREWLNDEDFKAAGKELNLKNVHIANALDLDPQIAQFLDFDFAFEEAFNSSKDQRYTLMPASNGQHWVSLIIDKQDKTFMIYDPMGSTSAMSQKNRPMFDQFANILKKEKFSIGREITFPKEIIHQRGNDFDCGIYNLRMAQEIDLRADAGLRGISEGQLRFVEPFASDLLDSLVVDRINVNRINKQAMVDRYKLRKKIYPGPDVEKFALILKKNLLRPGQNTFYSLSEGLEAMGEQLIADSFSLYSDAFPEEALDRQTFERKMLNEEKNAIEWSERSYNLLATKENLNQTDLNVLRDLNNEIEIRRKLLVINEEKFTQRYLLQEQSRAPAAFEDQFLERIQKTDPALFKSLTNPSLNELSYETIVDRLQRLNNTKPGEFPNQMIKTYFDIDLPSRPAPRIPIRVQ